MRVTEHDRGLEVHLGWPTVAILGWCGRERFVPWDEIGRITPRFFEEAAMVALWHVDQQPSPVRRPRESVLVGMLDAGRVLELTRRLEGQRPGGPGRL